jgi:hypothetical protein
MRGIIPPSLGLSTERSGRQQQALRSSHRDLIGSDLGQLPNCYMRPSAKLAVKPTNWWR